MFIYARNRTVILISPCVSGMNTGDDFGSPLIKCGRRGSSSAGDTVHQLSGVFLFIQIVQSNDVTEFMGEHNCRLRICAVYLNFPVSQMPVAVGDIIAERGNSTVFGIVIRFDFSGSGSVRFVYDVYSPAPFTCTVGNVGFECARKVWVCARKRIGYRSSVRVIPFVNAPADIFPSNISPCISCINS